MLIAESPQTVKYLFVRPRALESQLPQSPDATHTLAELRKAAEKTSTEHALHFFHKASRPAVPSAKKQD